MKDPRDYCPTCDATVNVREESKCWGCQWRCLVCGTVTDQDIDDDCQDHDSLLGCQDHDSLDDDPEEDVA